MSLIRLCRYSSFATIYSRHQKQVYALYLRYVCCMKIPAWTNRTANTLRSYFYRTFVEFTTRMNESKAFYLSLPFKPFTFRCSSCCILSFFLLLLFVVTVLAYFLSLLCSLVYFCSYSRFVAIALLLVAVLATFFSSFVAIFSLHYLFVAVLAAQTSLLLFTLDVALSIRYSHCLLSRRFFSQFSFDDF